MKCFLSFAAKTALMIVVASAAIDHAGAVEGDKAGNGGDEIGLRFQELAATAFTLLDAGALTAAQKVAYTTELSGSRYVVVDDTLYATLPGAAQESVAINQPANHLVYINRLRWPLLGALEQLQIALHEVLGLIGVEGTGDYHVSMTLAKISTPAQIPGSVLIYSLYFDNSDLGLAKRDAETACSVQRAAFADDYKIIYCAYLEKPDPNPQRPSRYGVKVFGYGYVMPGATWTVLFSSLYATMPMIFETAHEARDVCAQVLADSLLNDPKYVGARCFVLPQGQQFFYEIKTNAKF